MTTLALNATDLKGVYTALVTPMELKTKDSGDSTFSNPPIEWKKLNKLIEEQVRCGVTGVVPCGTTGQSATLSHDEHVKLALECVKIVNGRTQIIISAGSNSTQEAINLTNRIETGLNELGYDGATFLHVTGYYNCPPSSGIKAHYQALTQNFKSPKSNLIIYNVPSRTNCNISAETLIELATNEKIIGVKEVGGIEQAREVANATTNKDFNVLCGEDYEFAAMLKVGATGAITAAGNLAPSLLNQIYSFKREPEADNLQLALNEILDFIYMAKNPIPLCQALNSAIRLPLIKLDEVDSSFKALKKDNISINLDLFN
jgi:4-hydroxy-tetrahydrodipicolinate synthase